MQIVETYHCGHQPNNKHVEAYGRFANEKRVHGFPVGKNLQEIHKCEKLEVRQEVGGIRRYFVINDKSIIRHVEEPTKNKKEEEHEHEAETKNLGGENGDTAQSLLSVREADS